MSKSFGIIPCAGSQTRMNELTFAKELLPLFDGRPVVQHSIDCLRRATTKLVAVVNPKKIDLVRYLKSQSIMVLPYADSKGPIDSLFFAAQRFRQDFLFCLSDTYYYPEDVFVRLADSEPANVLGLFKSTSPERFDSVMSKAHSLGGSPHKSPKGRGLKPTTCPITQYASKVNPPLSPWIMGCGKLSLSSAKYIPAKSGEIIFEDLFKPMSKAKILYGLKLADSTFHDLGTPTHYIEYLLHRFPVK
jgi:hypothetical protein